MSGGSVERRLGFVTPNQQRYPGLRTEDALTALQSGYCPFCGAGPFAMPLSHVSRTHGISGPDCRAMLGVGLHDTAVTLPPEESARVREYAAAAVVAARQVLNSRPRSQRSQRTTPLVAAAHEAKRKPLPPCVICGALVARHSRKTCSPVCTSALRQRVAAQPRAKRERCRRGHLFTPENTYVHSDGHRACLTCRRDATAAWNARTRNP